MFQNVFAVPAHVSRRANPDFLFRMRQNLQPRAAQHALHSAAVRNPPVGGVARILFFNEVHAGKPVIAENILVPGGPQDHYHQLVEEAYAALGLIETQVDELRAELEYQYKRLDEARDAAFAEAIERQE